MGRNLKELNSATSQMLPQSGRPELQELSELVAELSEEEALAQVKRCIAAGIPAGEILSACQQGMRMVGAMHERGEYFLAGLIMAGEIMRLVVELLRPSLISQKPEKLLGRVVLGTIEGDIHDIGKNLFKDLLECHGFEVLDLGVNVAPADFLKAGGDFDPQWVAVSALITESFPHLRALVDLYHKAVPEPARRPRILIGGAQLDERIFNMSGADFWASDVFDGLRLCLRQAAAEPL